MHHIICTCRCLMYTYINMQNYSMLQQYYTILLLRISKPRRFFFKGTIKVRNYTEFATPALTFCATKTVNHT